MGFGERRTWETLQPLLDVGRDNLPLASAQAKGPKLGCKHGPDIFSRDVHFGQSLASVVRSSQVLAHDIDQRTPRTRALRTRPSMPVGAGRASERDQARERLVSYSCSCS